MTASSVMGCIASPTGSAGVSPRSAPRSARRNRSISDTLPFVSESGKQSESAKQLAEAEAKAKERFERAMTELREGAYRFSSRARGQSELIIEELIDPDGDTVAGLAEEGDHGAVALSQSLELIRFD